MLSSKALELGYATSVAHIDAGERSLAFPFRIYREVCAAMRIPTKMGMVDFDTALDLIVSKLPEDHWLYTHRLLGTALDLLRRGKLSMDDRAALTGVPVRSRVFPPPLRNRLPPRFAVAIGPNNAPPVVRARPWSFSAYHQVPGAPVFCRSSTGFMRCSQESGALDRCPERGGHARKRKESR